MKGAFLPILRCEAVVYRRDTYRVIGGKKHRAPCQCRRRHGKDSRFCWQHAKRE